MKRLAANWPEDLVIAPIPGYSPQIGWNLTLGGGYFLQSGDAESEAPPSVVGGFVMGAENGSYAYGGGANLHSAGRQIAAEIRCRLYGRSVSILRHRQ